MLPLQRSATVIRFFRRVTYSLDKIDENSTPSHSLGLTTSHTWHQVDKRKVKLPAPLLDTFLFSVQRASVKSACDRVKLLPLFTPLSSSSLGCWLVVQAPPSMHANFRKRVDCVYMSRCMSIVDWCRVASIVAVAVSTGRASIGSDHRKRSIDDVTQVDPEARANVGAFFGLSKKAGRRSKSFSLQLARSIELGNGLSFSHLKK